MIVPKCECIPGHFLCVEAVKLWDEVSRRYYAKEWIEFHQAYKKYEDHIKAVKRRLK